MRGIVDGLSGGPSAELVARIIGYSVSRVVDEDGLQSASGTTGISNAPKEMAV